MRRRMLPRRVRMIGKVVGRPTGRGGELWGPEVVGEEARSEDLQGHLRLLLLMMIWLALGRSVHPDLLRLRQE